MGKKKKKLCLISNELSRAPKYEEETALQIKCICSTCLMTSVGLFGKEKAVWFSTKNKCSVYVSTYLGLNLWN